MEKRQTAWESAGQVSKSYRKTPVFRDSMKFILFNPAWTLPLDKQIPIFLRYRTVESADGMLILKPDIDSRYADVLAVRNGQFRLALSEEIRNGIGSDADKCRQTRSSDGFSSAHSSRQHRCIFTALST